MNTTTTSPSSSTAREPDQFPGAADAVRRFAADVQPPFFRTESPELFKVYLSGFAPSQQQSHNCHACRRFIESFGDLVTIDESGQARSLFWSADTEAVAPLMYRAPIELMREVVERAPITGVFLSALASWGTASTHDSKRGMDWSHFVCAPLQRFVHPLKTADQVMADKLEEFGMLERGLAEFPRDAVAKAKALLGSESMYRGEKTVGVATWLLDLHDALAKTKNARIRRGLTWRAVAAAAPGFCHVRSSMIGTLLEDIVSGMPFDQVRRRFAEKMDPLKYQRAQVAPSQGNIDEAERIVAKLGTAGALERRFAKLEDVEAIWKPWTAAEPEKAAGVFGHLKPKAEPEITDLSGAAGGITMTWDKFSREVLPLAERIEMKVPPSGNFIALVTNASPDAPPMIQWDRAEKRNPVSWYLYKGGSPASRWALRADWTDITAITLLPPNWHGAKPGQHGEGVILLLAGAHDTAHESGGGHFTENLKSDYHAIRRTLEAHSKGATIAGRDEATACGYDLRKGSRWDVAVRVTAGGLRTRYILDRWD